MSRCQVLFVYLFFSKVRDCETLFPCFLEYDIASVVIISLILVLSVARLNNTDTSEKKTSLTRTTTIVPASAILASLIKFLILTWNFLMCGFLHYITTIFSYSLADLMLRRVSDIGKQVKEESVEK